MKTKRRKGSKHIVRGRLYGFFWLGQKTRDSVPLPGVDKDDAAAVAARCELIANVGADLVDAGRAERALDFAARLGLATSQKEIGQILKQVKVTIESTRALAGGATVRQFGKRYTDGDLAKMYPDHVKMKATIGDDEQRLETYVYPIVGSTPIASFHLSDAERVMAKLPAGRSPALRRHVAQVMHRLLTLAVYPAKVLAAHPLPRGFLPKLGPAKAKQCLYPDEDAKLMACRDVAIAWRLFYGVIDREGFRFAEARTLDWTDLDLKRGVVTLDKNKTDDPRAWALDPGVARALDIWRKLRPDLAQPFAEIPTNERQAFWFRDHVRLSGIDRAVLHERSETSMRLRFHDLRATFVTVALANGKTETWVSDRTGHRSHGMIEKYTRAARTYQDLNLGPLLPLDQAIVWEQSETAVKPSPGRGGRRTPKATRSTEKVHGAGVEPASPKAAEPKSHGKKRGAAASAKNKAAEPPSPTGAEAFHKNFTDDLRTIRRGWAAIEAVVDCMASAEGVQDLDDPSAGGRS